MTKQAYKGIIKGVFILAIVVVALLSGYEASFAETILISQTVGATQAQAFSWSTRYQLQQNVGTTLSTIDKTKDWSISIKTSVDPVFGNYSVNHNSFLVACSNNTANFIGLNNNVAGITYYYNSTTKIYTFNISSSWWSVGGSSCSGYPQVFSFSQGNSPTLIWATYGATTDVLTGDATWFNNFGNPTGSDTAITDVYLVVTHNITPVSISIIKPANLSISTSSPAFNSSGVYNLGSETFYIVPPLIDFNLSYHDTSTGQDLYTTLDAYNFYTSTTTASSTAWSRSLPLNLANAKIASSTYYKLTAKIISSPYNIVVASSTSIFYVDITGSGIPQPYIYIGGGGTIVSTTTGQILNGCNSNDINILQSVLCWIFIPRIETISQFGGLKTQIINKPPIGYLSAISDIITATTSTSTPIDNLIIPTGSASPFTILRTALTWLLWFIFGIFIFNRLRYLDLW